MSTCTASQTECIEEMFQRVASDLSMISDRRLVLSAVETERMDHRPAGEGQVHVSFRLAFSRGDVVGHGCLLVPLPDAISLASSLMMAPEEVVASSRGRTILDDATKGAMLELGSVVCGAAEAALRGVGIEDVDVAFGGCQGVRPDVRPALDYAEGDPLLVGRAALELEGFPEDRAILMLPACAFGG